ncbi:MarR family winged helix-turn-helix transcriptional regulator [Aliikangiella sp. IMCC44359]|uniref:MarR family winged helix-turn-helix transcriptional regulator n=1 Tax=Aliikangiella sp. IMCC44359 TaxID=3459125 RepID=UPI00403AB5D2
MSADNPEKAKTLSNNTKDSATAGEQQSSNRLPAGKVEYTIDLQSFLPYRMYRLATQMSQAGNKLSVLLAETGVPIGEREWRVISVLGSYGGLTNGHVADALKTDAATVTRAVKVLKKLNFVGTRFSKKDRRKQLIYLTEKGAAFHDLITPKRIETGELIESCFSYTEKEQLHHLLNKLDRHLHHLENEQEDEWE